MDEVSFDAVDEAIKNQLLDGNATLVWKNLVAKYEPKMSATKIQLKREFTQSCL